MFGRSNPATTTRGSREPEQRDDVVPHLRRRGRGERGHGRPPGQAVTPPAGSGGVLEAAVVRPEVVAPLRHAVRFVDDEPRDRHVAQGADEVRRGEALRRDVQQPARRPHAPSVDLAACVRRQHRVERRGPETATVQLVHLILHQRDERRHDERRPGQQQRRQLKAERLAGAGRHHRQQIVAVENSLDELLLSVAESAVAEKPVKRSDEVPHELPLYFLTDRRRQSSSAVFRTRGTRRVWSFFNAGIAANRRGS